MPRQFGDFIASELYCPKCRSSKSVREKLLLVLPSGELHEYLCSSCGFSGALVTVRSPSEVPQLEQRYSCNSPLGSTSRSFSRTDLELRHLGQ